jgi:hypothetical protein
MACLSQCRSGAAAIMICSHVLLDRRPLLRVERKEGMTSTRITMDLKSEGRVSFVAQVDIMFLLGNSDGG